MPGKDILLCLPLLSIYHDDNKHNDMYLSPAFAARKVYYLIHDRIEKKIESSNKRQRNKMTCVDNFGLIVDAWLTLHYKDPNMWH